MFSRETFDLDDIAQALADQTDYEHRWLIDPLPPRVWWKDMEDFALAVEDPKASARLRDALQERGAFRRFKHELYEWQSDLIGDWHAFRDARARQRALEWLEDNGLVERQPEDSDPAPDA